MLLLNFILSKNLNIHWLIRQISYLYHRPLSPYPSNTPPLRLSLSKHLTWSCCCFRTSIALYCKKEHISSPSTRDLSSSWPFSLHDFKPMSSVQHLLLHVILHKPWKALLINETSTNVTFFQKAFSQSKWYYQIMKLHLQIKIIGACPFLVSAFSRQFHINTFHQIIPFADPYILIKSRSSGIEYIPYPSG